MIDKIKEWWEINFNSKDYDPEQPVKLNYAFKEKEPSKRKMRKIYFARRPRSKVKRVSTSWIQLVKNN